MRKSLLAMLFALFAATPLFAAQPPEQARQMLESLLAATQSGNYERFMAPANATFRAAIPKEQFRAVSEQLAPRLKNGYEATYLGTLDQRGYDVHLWKLQFSDGDDDHLVKLSIEDGKVGGFWIQ